MCEVMKSFFDIIFNEVGIAAIALIVSVVTAYFQIQHNKNSVRPIINIVLGDYEDDLYIRLENNGSGPACIKSITCVYQNGEITQEANSVIEVLPTGIVSEYTTFIEDISGRAISPQANLVLLQKENPSEKELIALRNQLKECYLKVEYTDIYGNTIWSAERNLDFFGRTLL